MSDFPPEIPQILWILFDGISANNSPGHKKPLDP